MPSLPVPLISSLVLGFLLLRMWFVDHRGEGRRGPLVVLLALCAVQGVVISLAQHYGVEAMRPVQAITATFIPPMAWVSFQITAVRSPQVSDLAHLAAPVLSVIALVIQPYALDTLIPAVFVGYGFAILWQSLKGADALPRLRLGFGDLPGHIWTIIGASLIGSAFSDVLIVIVQILDVAQHDVAGYWRVEFIRRAGHNTRRRRRPSRRASQRRRRGHCGAFGCPDGG